MNCKKCGSPLEPNEVYCKNCGATVDVLVPGTPGVTPVSSVESVPVSQPEAPVQPASEIPATPVQTEVPSVPVQPTMPQPGVPVQPVAPTPNAVPVPPMQQPMVGMPTQSMPNGNGGKNKNIIIAAVAVVAILVVAIVLYLTVFNKKDDATSKNTNTNSVSNTLQNDESNSNVSNTNNNVQPSNTFSISHDGFIFQIPIEYQTQMSGDYLAISDNATFTVGIAAGDKDFNTLTEDVIEMNLRESMPSNSIITTDSYDTATGRKYFLAQVTIDGEVTLVAYTKANSLKTFIVLIAYSTNVEDTLNKVDTILSNAKADSNGFGIEKSNFDSSSLLF